MFTSYPPLLFLPLTSPVSPNLLSSSFSWVHIIKLWTRKISAEHIKLTKYRHTKFMLLLQTCFIISHGKDHITNLESVWRKTDPNHAPPITVQIVKKKTLTFFCFLNGFPETARTNVNSIAWKHEFHFTYANMCQS